MLGALVISAVLAAADGGVSALDGTWILDLERSTDPGPVLQRLEVPWVLRKVGPTVRVTNVIVTTAEKAVIEAKSTLIPSKRTTVFFDGVTPTKDDFFGHPFSYVTTIEGDTIVAKGEVILPKEGKVPLELRRRVDEEGRMVYRIICRPAGERPLEVLRVFTRK